MDYCVTPRRRAPRTFLASSVTGSTIETRDLAAAAAMERGALDGRQGAVRLRGVFSRAAPIGAFLTAEPVQISAFQGQEMLRSELRPSWAGRSGAPRTLFLDKTGESSCCASRRAPSCR